MSAFLSMKGAAPPALLAVFIACGTSAESPVREPPPDASIADAGAPPPQDAGVPIMPIIDASVRDAADAAFVEATHLALPLLRHWGGPLIAAPRVVSVLFPGDLHAADLTAFGATIASTPWWRAVSREYCNGNACIGDGPPGVAVTLGKPAAPSYDRAALEALLTGELDAGTLPAPDEDTVYFLYFPPTTTVTSEGLGESCKGFAGYHTFFTYQSKRVPYAVMPECTQTGNVTQLEYTTGTAAHELIEVATDPFPAGDTYGYWLDTDDPNAYGWSGVSGGEAGDLCVDYLGLDQDILREGPYIVQRSWSNASGAAGHDPCLPLLHPSDVYFNVAPRRAFFVLDVGETITFEADAFSDAPMRDWSVMVQDVTSRSASFLVFAIEGVPASGPGLTVNNGSKVRIEMTLLTEPPSKTEEALGLLVSWTGDRKKPTASHYWPFAVMSKVAAEDAGIDAMGWTAKRHGRVRAPYR